MHKRTQALAIPKTVKEAVAERDKFRGWTCCILCGKPAPPERPLAYSNAHYIPRSQGGLGVEENILTLCERCHYIFDSTEERSELKIELGEYLKSFYPEWDVEKIKYRKE